MPELVWDAKYDGDGQRAAPLRVALPFQTVETINESAQERQHSLDLFTGGRDTDWRNRLIWGDKKYVLPALLGEFTGAVDLIYIDPPFTTGQDFSYPVTIDGEQFVKEPSVIEQKAYRDTWGKDLDTYLEWFYSMTLLFHELLAPTGSLYVHCDWRVNSLVRLVLNEAFGADRLVNEVVWHYRTFQGQAHRYFAKKHDTLFWFSKTDSYTYNAAFDTSLEDTIDAKRWADYIDAQGNITAKNMPSHDSRFVRYLNKWKKEHEREPGPDDVVQPVYFPLGRLANASSSLRIFSGSGVLSVLQLA
jgi:DNA modification methylase